MGEDRVGGRTAGWWTRQATPRRGGRSARALIEAVFPSDPATALGSRRADADTRLQSLLSETLQRLARQTGAERLYVWSLRPDGSAWLAAAVQHEGEPARPDPAALARLLELPHASDLADPTLDPSLARLARERRLGAAVALRTEDAQSARPFAAILLGGPDDRAGHVRPRTLAALDEAAARLRGPASTTRSIARLQTLDESVRRLDRLALLGELLAEVVHEVRNPLVSVKTFLQLMPERRHDPEFHGEFRRVVSDEVGRLERLIDDVLDHARPESTRMGTRSADIERGFDAVAALLAHRARERSIEIQCQIEGPLPEAALSPDALRQLLLNLALNALDATPPGGSVTLRARNAGADARRSLEISVDDQGRGVDEALRERLFEPFFTTREDRPGGLGLAISRRLAEEAGGQLGVTDAPGGGARFALRLPAATGR